MYANAENLIPGWLADVDHVGFRLIESTVVHLSHPTVVEVWHEGGGRADSFPQLYRHDEKIRTLPMPDSPPSPRVNNRHSLARRDA